MIPRGTARTGSRASSAASGTPSTARKNQIANGKLAHTPTRPNGRNGDAPTASPAGMSVRFAVSKDPMAPNAKSTRPASAIAVITKVTLRASPTPSRWMPMKST